MSKIIRLESTNYKRLKAVEIAPDPDGNLVIVAGKNGQGKTSILDSITAALGGVNAKTTPKPIRDGEDRAEIVLETEDLIVTRRFTPSGSTLTVKSPDGAVYPKGQAKLDDLLGKLSLDPLAFTQLSDRDQLATLLDLVDLPFDLNKLAAERAASFDARTDIKREAKNLQAAAASIPVTPEMADLKPVSVNDLLTAYRNTEAEQLRLNRTDQAVDALKAAETATLAKLADIRRELAEAEIEQIRAADDMSDRSLEVIQSQIDNAEQINADVRTFESWIRASDAWSAAQQRVEDLTAKIAEIDRQKTDGLAKASFPGGLPLGFDETGVLLNGIPFRQASGAEQLRASLAMAIALNPKLRVIRIADGSLLDSDNLALVEAVAKENDFQVWIEMVGDGNGRGIIIEDGEVKV
ncbi:AAA family ATPase [Arthrobacter sp. PsM3]|uniref:AAA family ATPase n=1 Tax=Arthrobacter sp. PsM3 TaxID=3030531 RepID=UPI00263B78A3|nr:AAA family ATPase [Arthrobacter sp. PsM3]MDN4644959.1 AAA family ATPase [Arthrobacter sp. PsM3]